MVTGDHPITASAIARQIGLIGGKVDVVKEAGGAGRNRRQSIVVQRHSRFGRFDVSNAITATPEEGEDGVLF
jgi:magnesium-transporting ATPase (P-type)